MILIRRNIFFSALLALIFQGCSMLGGLPKGEEFTYEVGEIVYYKPDHMPMLIEKQLYKKKQKMYEVVFKNKEGHLLYNKVFENELLSSPPIKRARI